MLRYNVVGLNKYVCAHNVEVRAIWPAASVVSAKKKNRQVQPLVVTVS